MGKDVQIEKWKLEQGNGYEHVQAVVNFLDGEFGDRNANFYWTENLLNWKVGSFNLAGEGVIFSANLNGRTIASVTLTLKKLYFEKKVYLVAEIGDTYTSAEFLSKASRNKYACNTAYTGQCKSTEYINGSIFGRLVVEAVDWARQSGIQAVYGTPNKNSCAGYVKRLDFRLINIDSYRVRLRVILTAKLIQTKTYLPKGLTKIFGYGSQFLSQTILLRSTLMLNKFQINELIVNANAEFDDFWRSTLRRNKSSLVKDKNWLIWRYQIHPENNYKIFTIQSDGLLQGWLVLKIEQSKIRKTITICDWLYTLNTTLWMAFMLKVLRSLDYQDAIVKLWSYDNTSFNKQLWRLFSVSISDVNVIFKPLSEDAKEFNQGHIFDEFSIGDSDNV